MSSDKQAVIVLNPGSTSTKFALWKRAECIVEKVVRHDSDKLDSEIPKQFDYRRELIDQALEPLLEGVEIMGAAGRGGLLKPMKGGTYLVNDQMIADLSKGERGHHASNLGAILADHYAKRFGVDAYIVDPVTTDEFEELARVSGVPWIERKSRAHALNIKAVVRRAAVKLDIAVPDSRFVVAHLGGGISIAPVKGGRIIDVNDALLGMGPYSPERAGGLPIGPVIERCYSGNILKEDLIRELSRNSGLMAYCGTSDAREVLEKVKSGDKQANLAWRGMIYQIAKEIGAMASVLKGNIHGVVATGGLAHSQELTSSLKEYVAYIAPFIVFPGEGELQALAEGAWRVIDKQEGVKEYK